MLLFLPLSHFCVIYIWPSWCYRYLLFTSKKKFNGCVFAIVVSSSAPSSVNKLQTKSHGSLGVLPQSYSGDLPQIDPVPGEVKRSRKIYGKTVSVVCPSWRKGGGREEREGACSSTSFCDHCWACNSNMGVACAKWEAARKSLNGHYMR